MLNPNARILVFCKAPQPGKVKTRLAKDIGGVSAARVHKYLVQHTLQTVTSALLAPAELWCAPDTEHDFFYDCREHYGIPLKQQVGDDLGQRMEHALSEALRKYSPVVLIGTDCPAITPDYLQSALAAASQNETVIGPAEDGGYVLLGMGSLQVDLFTRMRWGTSQVYAETVKRLNGEARTLASLWDVDYLADLKRLHDLADELRIEKVFKEYLQHLDLS